MTFTEIMEYLMKNGANVNAANPDGQTVLMFAAGKKISNSYILRDTIQDFCSKLGIKL